MYISSWGMETSTYFVFSQQCARALGMCCYVSTAEEGEVRSFGKNPKEHKVPKFILLGSLFFLFNLLHQLFEPRSSLTTC